MTQAVVVLSMMLLIYSTVSANSIAYMYDTRQLEHEKPRYEQRLGELYNIILPLFTAQERRAFTGVKLEFPLVGSITGTPLDFYTEGQVGRVSVFMPVFSLLFLEDLATAFACLHVHGYSFETVEEYVTILKYKKASDFPGGRYPPPLKGLQIPPDAMSEERVKSLALALRNEAYAFILLHELGHVLYGHRGYEGILKEQTRKNEADSDRFALTILERADTLPMGMVLWFMAQVNVMPNKGQLMAEGIVKSEADWQSYLKTWATHPLTVDRLSAIALYLDGWAKRISAGNRRETLGYIAARLAHLAEGFGDPELQGCMAVVAYRAAPATLAPRRHKAETGGQLMREHCEKKR